MLSRREFARGGVACASLAWGSVAACAASSDAFYKGKTISLVIGYPPGGANDVYARLLAQYLGQYIPGHPAVVPQNMPGAGSFVAVNNVYNAAPKDGLTIGLGAPTLALDEKLGTKGVHFKTAQLNWIGRLNPLINIVMTWKTCPVKTIAQAERTQVTLSGTGAGSTVSIYPTVLNNVLGTKFKLVMGYSGSREAMLAMERGEVEGHSTAWEAVKEAHPDWLRDKEVNILVQFALRRDPELAHVPTAVELGRNDQERKVLAAIMSASEIGESFFTTPAAPHDRVAILRRAFDQAAKDPRLRADAKRMKLGVAPLSGGEIQTLVATVADLSPDLLARVKAAYPSSG
jgi:tripartite-type tricarboxylate transporter receptor subunit TctC